MDLKIVARAHTDAEVAHLQSLGADVAIMAERETARAMVAPAFHEGDSGGSDPNSGPDDDRRPVAAGI